MIGSFNYSVSGKNQDFFIPMVDQRFILHDTDNNYELAADFLKHFLIV